MTRQERQPDPVADAPEVAAGATHDQALARGMPQADRKGWWPHGMTNTKASTSPISYLVSYAKKIDSKN